MHSTVQVSGNKSGKSNVWANQNLAKTVASLDEFKNGFPSQGLTTVSKKWWGRPGEGENAEDDAGSEKQNSLVAIRKRIAEQGREAVELGMRQGFCSKRPDKRDQQLVSQIFKSDWVTDSS